MWKNRGVKKLKDTRCEDVRQPPAADSSKHTPGCEAKVDNNGEHTVKCRYSSPDHEKIGKRDDCQFCRNRRCDSEAGHGGGRFRFEFDSRTKARAHAGHPFRFAR